MKILVMSDSHGWDKRAAEAVRREQPFDVLLHLGDVQEMREEFLRHVGLDRDFPAYLVEGNCDREGQYPDRQVVEVAGHRIFLVHGHLHSVRFGTDILHDEAAMQGCDLALYGHTHRPDLCDRDPGLLILNPGSITWPRQEDHQPSYMVLDLYAARRPSVVLKYLTSE